MVLQENDSSLCTTAIRPHLIWGPGDPHLIPRILQKANVNRLMIVGEGMNQVDMTYIDNAVSAHGYGNLVIIGHGKDEKKLRQLCLNLNISKNNKINLNNASIPT